MEAISLNELKKIIKSNTAELPRIKVALLGDSATQLLAIAIKGMGINYKTNIELFESEYNQIEHQVINPASELHRFDPDFTIIFHSTHKLLSSFNKTSADDALRFADNRLNYIRSISETLTSKVIYLNYPEIDNMIFGSYANKVETSFIFQLRKLNYKLMELSQQTPNLFICDLSTLQNKYGRDFLFSPSVYTNTEMVISIDALPFVASQIVKIISALRGSFKKCLILDLDNTLWGGVIGDDGLEGIQIGHGLGIGKAFTEFQNWIKKLKERGVILAVCSKNEETIAKEPFSKHPDMVLNLDDIAVFIANWNNKADNIRDIQSILNIGFDSMVFIDDNPFERNIVRENIPEICVPELPEDPADYLEYLYSLNIFETASFNVSDKDRTKQYKQETHRLSTKYLFTDEKGYLKSLNMLATVSSFNAFNCPRVAQLSQRSNQFNLRTVRYSEYEIQQIENNDQYKSFCFNLEDKFGDNGLICVVVLEKDEKEKSLFINTWLMSCRVLKRGMENFTLNTIVDYAIQNGFEKLIGEYILTAKNKLVENHFQDLGFTPCMHENKNLFELVVNDYENKDCYINSKHS